MTEHTDDQIKALKLEAKTEILEKISDVVKPTSKRFGNRQYSNMAKTSIHILN